MTPIIDITDGNLAEQGDQAWEALIKWANGDSRQPRIVARSNVLMRMDGIEGLIPYRAPNLKDSLSRAATFQKTLANGNTRTRYPPDDIVEALLARGAAEWSGAPQVQRVTSVPVVSEDGAVIHEPGLDSSGVWYRPAAALEGLVVPDSDEIDVDDVIAARDLLMNELLGDFDFADEASKANALGLVLLPFVREYIGNNPTPLHLIIAPQPGSGKTYCAEVCLSVGCGPVDISSESRDDDELRKRITARLMAARPAIVFDNLSRELASATLAAILTTSTWSDRVLQQSRDLTVPNRLIYVATGNNVVTSNELRDRTCPIWLIPREGVPARRRSSSDFRHPDLKGWAIENRRELAAACLTLISHWLGGKGRMRADGTFARDEERHLADRTLGSFERWAEVIGGILAAAEVHGFLGNLASLEVADVESEETATFYAAIAEWSETAEFDLAALVGACLAGGPLSDRLPGEVNERDLRKSLGYWLRAHKDATHGTHVLKVRDHGIGTSGGRRLWRVDSL